MEHIDIGARIKEVQYVSFDGWPCWIGAELLPMHSWLRGSMGLKSTKSGQDKTLISHSINPPNKKFCIFWNGHDPNFAPMHWLSSSFYHSAQGQLPYVQAEVGWRWGGGRGGGGAWGGGGGGRGAGGGGAGGGLISAKPNCLSRGMDLSHQQVLIWSSASDYMVSYVFG